MQKKILIPIVILAVVAIVVSVGPVADMLDPAKGRYEELRSHCDLGECALADEELQIIIDQHANSRYVSRAKESVAECYWESALYFLYGEEYQDGKEDYASATEKADIVLSRFLDTEYASKVRKSLPGWYDDWSGKLAEEGDYDGAAEKLLEITEKCPDYEYMDLVWSDIVDLLLEKAAELKDDGEYDKAIAEYDRIAANYLDHAPSYKAEDVDEAAIECYFDWGAELQGEEEFAEALEKYRAVAEEYPSIYLLDMGDLSHDVAGEAMASCYCEWASSLKEAGDYGGALEKYLVVAEDLHDTNLGDYATEAVPETCYQWASSLENQTMYAEALEKYTLLIESYSSYPYPYQYKSEAEAAIPRLYLSWASSLEEQGEYEDALEKYGLIIEEYSEYPYPDEYASEAENGIAGCYYGWASELIDGGEFEEALEKYSVVVEEYPDSGWASEGNSTLLGDVPGEVLFDSAAQFKEDEKYNTAIMLYKAVANYHPDSVYAHDAANAAIDTEIEKIYKESHGTLPPPYPTKGKSLGGKCEVTIVNDVPYALTVLISGPANMSITIDASPGSSIRIVPPFSWQDPPEAAESVTVKIPAGDYRVAARVREPGIIPFYGEWSLPGDTIYVSWFYLMQTFG